MSDDDNGNAMYQSQTNIVPGYTEKRCIEVTYNGTAALSKVDLYAAVTPAGAAAGDTLADDLDVTVQIGPAASKCNLTDTGFTDVATGLSTVPAESTVVNNKALSSFGTELAPETMSWVPNTSAKMRPFLFTVTLGNDTDNNAQGDSATATFTFRIRGVTSDGAILNVHAVSHITADAIDFSVFPPMVEGVKVMFDKFECR